MPQNSQMDYKATTMVPNTVFEKLQTLSEKELKVLLVVLRQTIGWIDKNGKRKSRDWISHRYFIMKTGLSRKSISQAISLLIKKGYIKAESETNGNLEHSSTRKGRMRIYYSCMLFSKVELTTTKGKNVLTTKLTDTKLNPQTKVKSTQPLRLTDLQRYQQILRSQGLYMDS